MMDLSHSPLLQAISNNAEKFANRVALIEGNSQVSYSELWKKIIDAASFLCYIGLQYGDNIILSARKELEFVYIYFGAHLLGVRNVVIDPTSNDERKQYIVSTVHPKCIFGFYCKNIQSIDYRDVSFRMPIISNLSKVSLHDVADIMFTTGTTGNPKGVLLTHLNIYASAYNINNYMGNTSNDIELLGLPICHSFGLGRLRCTLINGATIVILGNFANIKLVFQAIEQYHVTMFGMVPAVWAYIKKFSGTKISKYANQIKYIEIGSAAMQTSEKEELMKLFPNTRICMHYGLTEASRSTFIEFHQSKGHLNSIGKPVSSVVAIQIMDSMGKECPVKTEGEICVKGNMVISSYLLPEDNQNAFRDGFFRTGDWGYKDEDGFIYLTGRLKEMINVGGKKVSPVEVENAIISLGIEDCVCVGIDDPRGVLGQVVKAYLLKGTSNLTFEDIMISLMAKLEHFKVPVEYEWVDKIPKTLSGKKQRLLLCKK